jgi:hypothetical protein
LVFSFAVGAGVSACNGDDAGTGDEAAGAGSDDAGTGGTLVTGGTASGGGAARGGVSSSGGTSGSGSGLATGRGGSNSPAGGGGPASGGTASNAGRSGSTNGGAGAPEPPGGNTGNSPYEIECHGDTAMCGSPTSLLCLGLRIGTEVLGYSCANECQSDADCSELPSSTDAAAGCIDFVNKKYCLLVCKNGDEEWSCPTGMYCYVYEGTPTGYCLWR